MISSLLFFTLVKFSWVAPPSGGVLVTGYHLCVDTVPGGCGTTATVGPAVLQSTLDLDLTKTWYATVRSTSAFGDSAGSNQVVAGFPQAPVSLVATVPAP